MKTAWKPGSAIEVGTEDLLEAIEIVTKFVRKAPLHFRSEGTTVIVYAWDGAGDAASSYCTIRDGCGDLYFCLDREVAKTHFSIRREGSTVLRLDTAWINGVRTSGTRLRAVQIVEDEGTEFDIATRDEPDPMDLFEPGEEESVIVRTSKLAKALSMACAVIGPNPGSTTIQVGAKDGLFLVWAIGKNGLFQRRIKGPGAGDIPFCSFSPRSISALAKSLYASEDSSLAIKGNFSRVQFDTSPVCYTIVPTGNSSPPPNLAGMVSRVGNPTQIVLNRISFLSTVRASVCASKAEGGTMRPMSLSLESEKVGVLVSGMNLNCPSYVRSTVPILLTPGDVVPRWISFSPITLLPILEEIPRQRLSSPAGPIASSLS